MEYKYVYVTYEYNDGIFSNQRVYNECFTVYCEMLTESAIIREIRNRYNDRKDIAILDWHE